MIRRIIINKKKMSLSTHQIEYKKQICYQVREEYVKGNTNIRALAKKYECSHTYIFFLLRGKGIKWVEQLNLPSIVVDQRYNQPVDKS